MEAPPKSQKLHGVGMGFVGATCSREGGMTRFTTAVRGCKPLLQSTFQALKKLECHFGTATDNNRNGKHQAMECSNGKSGLKQSEVS